MEIIDKYILSEENTKPTKFSNEIKDRYSRYGMYKRIENFLKSLNLTSGKCLFVGDTYDGIGTTFEHLKCTAQLLINMLPVGTIVTAPPYPEVDMHKMPYEDNTFDYVLADQVIEHVRKPWICVEEVRRVLKLGGIAVLTSGLMCPVHGQPDDYFRFTPFGLKVLCENFSNILECDGNGSRNLINDIWVRRLQRKGVTGNPERESRALKSDGTNLIMTWIIAKK